MFGKMQQIMSPPSDTILPASANEQQYFIIACHWADLQAFYQAWIAQKKDRIQLFYACAGGSLQHRYWCPEALCCHSRQPLTPANTAIKVGYWTPHIWRPVHRDLLAEAKLIEAGACQEIDCSCNDCKHFERQAGLKGTCKKFGRPVTAHPNHCHPENLACFEHRRK